PAPVFHSPGAVRNTRLSRRWKISSRSRPEEINAPRSARILALTITAAAPGKFLNHIERHWNEENSNDGRREHAAHYRRPEDLPGLSARATSDRQRDHTQDERERRHQNRPQSYPRGGQRRVGDRLSSFVFTLGELDNEDGVLGGQADEHNETNLREHVILKRAQP